MAVAGEEFRAAEHHEHEPHGEEKAGEAAAEAVRFRGGGKIAGDHGGAEGGKGYVGAAEHGKHEGAVNGQFCLGSHGVGHGVERCNKGSVRHGSSVGSLK